MAKLDELLQVRLGNKERGLLDRLAKISDTNMSFVIRELIPGAKMIEALGAYYEAYNLDLKSLPREFISRVASFFEQQMAAVPGDSNIAYQVKLLCQKSDPDREEKLCALYTTWIRACRDVEKYRLVPVCWPEGKVCTHIAIGPDDDAEYIAIVENVCRELLKKTGEDTTKILDKLMGK
jgi:hypothetical protein